MNRRNFLRNTSLLTLGTGLVSPIELSAKGRKPDLQVAFLSDIHVKPTDAAEKGMRKALQHVNSLKRQPHFIINGGDSIMDALGADKLKTQGQWDVWNRVMTDENRLPVYHVIGNHDIWGWQVKDQTIKTDPLYDKAWVIKQHNMPGRYYSFEKKGWKFIVLDSTQENNGGYIARLDEQQYSWLEQELKKTPSGQHIAIVSHIPIVSFCSAMFFDDHLANGDWKLSRALLHVDARTVTQLFSAFKNIRCCLSGHIHLQDKVEYKGIEYYCNGAVSGNWWGGAFKGFDPAYALFDFNREGKVSRRIINY
jgi:3',5'-cyclic-AMP phosphodiesterase